MTPLRISIDEQYSVSALWMMPPSARWSFVFAHGAGAGMEHRAMAELADVFFARDIATLRYQFPFMENGRSRPDPPAIAHATIRAAVATAAELAPELPLFAGGRSFGGRMTSQAQAQSPLPNVHGLVFLGFPLHPARTPSTDRAQHLQGVEIPMLFVQGERDALATMALLRPTVAELGTRATLHIVNGADHGFAVPARSGRTARDVAEEIASVVASWAE